MSEAAQAAPVVEPGNPPADTNPAPVNEPVNEGADKAVDPPVASEPAKAIAEGGNPEPSEPVAGKWPDDWRQQLAGDDPKALDRLGRFSSPSDIFKAYREAEARISKGLKPMEKPGKDATDEEWAEYRKAREIPDKVEDYVKAIELPDQRKIGDDDKPLVDAFSERAIKSGISPKDLAPLIDEYYAIQEEQANQLAEKDAEFRTQSMQGLREEFGGDFKANINAMRPYFESVDPEMFDNLLGGRLADGTKIGDNPSVIKFFVAKALAENPAATVVPAGANQIDTIETEIKALEGRMREDRAGWFKDQAAQDRYQKLIAAREKLSAA